MRCRVLLFVAVGALLWPAVSAFAQDQSTPVSLTRAEQEEFLRTAEILSTRTSTQGITAPQNATLSDGTLTHRAQIQDVDIFEREFKTIRGTEINFRDSYKYYIAAYVLDKHLDLNMVPVSVERRVDGRGCAVTWWVDDFMMNEWQRVEQKQRSPDPRGWASQMYIVRVFDQLIDNTDRTGQNLLITNEWKIWMIDHSRAFRTRKALRAPENLEWIERGLLATLRELDVATLTELLSDSLTNSEIEGVAARAELIVTLFDEQIAEKGAGAVLYDMPAR